MKREGVVLGFWNVERRSARLSGEQRKWDWEVAGGEGLEAGRSGLAGRWAGVVSGQGSGLVRSDKRHRLHVLMEGGKLGSSATAFYKQLGPRSLPLWT